MPFQGEEWGASTPFLYFTGFADQALGQAVSQGRRREFAAFGWAPEDVPDPQDPVTFQRSRLDWTELERQPHAGLLDWHRRLIRLRRETPELTSGRLEGVQVAFDETDQWLSVTRQPVVAVCNLAGHTQAVPIPHGQPPQVLLASASDIGFRDQGVLLPPDSVAVLRLSPAPMPSRP